MSKVSQCKQCGFMTCDVLIEDELCPFCASKRGGKDILCLWGVIALDVALWICVIYLAAKLGKILGEWV